MILGSGTTSSTASGVREANETAKAVSTYIQTDNAIGNADIASHRECHLAAEISKSPSPSSYPLLLLNLMNHSASAA